MGYNWFHCFPIWGHLVSFNLMLEKLAEIHNLDRQIFVLCAHYFFTVRDESHWAFPGLVKDLDSPFFFPYAHMCACTHTHTHTHCHTQDLFPPYVIDSAESRPYCPQWRSRMVWSNLGRACYYNSTVILDGRGYVCVWIFSAVPGT